MASVKMIRLSGLTSLFLSIFFFSAYSSFAQRASANAAQTFSLKVSKMMDIGFENDAKSSANPKQTKLEDIMKGSEATYSFKLRTNEDFRLSLNTGNRDSTGVNTDSLLQVKMLKEDNNDDTSGYKNISTTPQTVFTGNNDNSDQSFTIKYRAKPGAVFPPGLKKLNLLYTASHP